MGGRSSRRIFGEKRVKIPGKGQIDRNWRVERELNGRAIEGTGPSDASGNDGRLDPGDFIRAPFAGAATRRRGRKEEVGVT